MSEPGWAPLPPALDGSAALFLADCAEFGATAPALAAIIAARDDPDSEIYGWVEGDEVVAVYGLRQSRLKFDLLWLAVAPDRRERRYGRSALVDALRRCGRKPMTTEVDDSIKGWFERVGFKTVGRRPKAEGGYRFRLGWYAPRRPAEPGYGAHPGAR